MALQPQPYYTNSLDQSEGGSSFDKNDGHYPDINPLIASNAHMYSLADGALQMHGDPTDRHFAGLAQAATAAAGQEASYAQDNSYFGTPRRSTRHSRATGAGESGSVVNNTFFYEPCLMLISRRRSTRNYHCCTR